VELRETGKIKEDDGASVIFHYISCEVEDKRMCFESC
jgi:hypothetical protein